MKNVAKVIVFVYISVFAIVANANVLQLGWYNITLIHTYKTHTGILYKTDYMVSNDCPSGNYYILPRSHPFFEENSEMLFTARILGKKVHLSIEGCLEQYPVIKDLFY